jgi:uncharacterized protein (TIGR00730 family)
MDRELNEPRGHNSSRISRVAVYAASSRQLDEAYIEAASRVGKALAMAGMSIIYGGGGTGLMGAVADAALAHGARVHGVVPEFLLQLECAHTGLTAMDVVDDMRERKHRMLSEAHALVTLPGGCGTYEELFEALTLKRLGQWTGPIVLVNTRGFYDRLLDFLEHSVKERFMAQAHARMWSVVTEPEAVPAALATAPRWTAGAIEFANV